MRTYLWSLLLVALAAGCQADSTPATDHAPKVHGNDLGREFDASSSGDIVGMVRWHGAKPVVPPLRIFTVPGLGKDERERPNPHAPRIDAGGGVADAVVFLRHVDPEKSKPWDHEPV